MKGSLAKLYFGNNIQILSKNEGLNALEMLNDFIHLPVTTGKVSRFDIGYNLETKYPVTSYYDFLGPGRTYKSMEQPAAIYFDSNKDFLSNTKKSSL